MMTPYENLGGRSGVAAYKVTRDAVVVRFRDGSVYYYDDYGVEPDDLERMKALARRGHGLHAFINTVVRFQYSRRLGPPVRPRLDR